MKKLFLMLLAVLGFGAVSAQTDTKPANKRDTMNNSKVNTQRPKIRSAAAIDSTKQLRPDVGTKNTVPTKSDNKDGQPMKRQPESGNGKTTPNIPVK